MSPLRDSVERASLPVLTWLSGLPKAVPFLVVLALMVGGALIPGWGWILIALVSVFLSWILFLSWPRLNGTERLMRVAVVVLAAGVAVVRANPRT